MQIGGGVLGDLFAPHERGQAIAIYSLAPLLGPVVGPVAGAWIAEKSTWRWVFWSTTLVDAAVQVVGVFALQESLFFLLWVACASADSEAASLCSCASRAQGKFDPEEAGHHYGRCGERLQ
jgi:MFS family permease